MDSKQIEKIGDIVLKYFYAVDSGKRLKDKNLDMLVCINGYVAIRKMITKKSSVEIWNELEQQIKEDKIPKYLLYRFKKILED